MLAPLLGLCLLNGCAGAANQQTTRLIPAGSYTTGSSAEERRWGYQHSPPLVYQQRWYDSWERPPSKRQLQSFRIDRWPVTQTQYRQFVTATGHRQPTISPGEYQRQGFLVHPYAGVRPYLWRDNRPPPGIDDHPVVLVSQDDAAAYCHWRGARLPDEQQWEASCRGKEQRRFPWGNQWQADRLQSDTRGTAPVDAHPTGATPQGVGDLLGNVFEWTSTAYSEDRSVLKGCSWDDAPGTCRCGFRHGRPATSKHILIGFRCVTEETD